MKEGWYGKIFVPFFLHSHSKYGKIIKFIDSHFLWVGILE